MNKSDILLMWIVVIGICFLALTRPGDWLNMIRTGYAALINRLKWHPYLPYLTGPGKGKGHSQGTFDFDDGNNCKAQKSRFKIFPRSRRTT